MRVANSHTDKNANRMLLILLVFAFRRGKNAVKIKEARETMAMSAETTAMMIPVVCVSVESFKLGDVLQR